MAGRPVVGRPVVRPVVRLAGRNLRHRPGQAALLLVALCLATSSVATGLAVSAAADGAVQRLSDATAGYHVYVKSFSPDEPAARAAKGSALADLRSGPGVAAAGGPWPVHLGSTRALGGQLQLRLQVRDDPVAAVDQPHLTAGSWLDGGEGVVLEDGLADALHLRPGDRLVVDGVSLPVLGAAMTTSTQRYPLESPALVWVSPATMARLPAAPKVYDWLELRLRDPAGSVAAAERLTAALPGPPELWEVHEWQERQAAEEGSSPVRDLGILLLLAGGLLAALSTLTAAVLVGSRLAQRARQTGVLKTVGMTPGQVSAAVLVEAGVLAGVATVVGTVVGVLAAPALAGTVATLYGGPDVPWFDPARLGILAAVALVLVVAAVARPALRSARTPAGTLLLSPARPPHTAGRVGRLAGRVRLPVCADVALRALLRRRGRLVANLTTVMLGVALATLGLSLRGSTLSVTAPADEPADPVSNALAQALFDRLQTVVLVAASLLVVLAVVNTVITATFTALDARRTAAVLTATGATPGQVTAGFVAAQLAVGTLAIAAGAVIGRLLYGSMAAGLERPSLPAAAYAGVVLAAVVVQAVALAAPGRVLRRAGPAATLAAEHG